MTFLFNKLLVFFSVYPRLIILSILLILSKKLVSICVNSWLKNKAKSQVNVTKVLTDNYEDQRLSEKKRTQFVGQNP